MMVRPQDMPPDPFEDDSIDDRMALEHAEELARHGADPASTVWERFDGPDMFDFDEAAREIASLESGSGQGPVAEARYAAWKAALAAVAVIVVIALLVVYVF